MSFTMDELSILQIYASAGRDKAIEDMTVALDAVEEPIIQQTLASTISKARALSPKTFAALDFSVVPEPESPISEKPTA